MHQAEMTSNFCKVSIFVPVCNSVCILIVKIRLSPHTIRLQIILVATMETKSQQSISSMIALALLTCVVGSL